MDAAFWPYLTGTIHRQGNGHYSPELPDIWLPAGDCCEWCLNAFWDSRISALFHSSSDYFWQWWSLISYNTSEYLWCDAPVWASIWIRLISTLTLFVSYKWTCYVLQGSDCWRWCSRNRTGAEACTICTDHNRCGCLLLQVSLYCVMSYPCSV